MLLETNTIEMCLRLFHGPVCLQTKMTEFWPTATFPSSSGASSTADGLFSYIVVQCVTFCQHSLVCKSAFAKTANICERFFFLFWKHVW